MENPFLYTPLEVLQHFKVSEKGGLSKDQVLQSRKRFGYNGKPS
jgi:Ca2+ transporting ATPase